MEKVIIVTGTPGTGKTSIARGIAKYYNYEYILIGEHKDYLSGIDGGVKIIDVNKMIKWIKSVQATENKTLVIDSHISHHYPPELARICIITRCDPQELKLRLKERGYDSRKIETNLEAEAMNLITQEAMMEGHLVHEINTTNRTDNSSITEAISVIDKSTAPESGKIDFTYYLMKKK